jgi:predicted O-methyltransferase YrrM
MTGFNTLLGGARRWDFLASLIGENAHTFVEVGCKEGRTTGHILKSCPKARVVAIDPWLAQEATDDPLAETYEKWDFEKIEAEFWKNVGEHRDRCVMLRMTSEAAVVDFGPPADLVFIDARHDHDSVLEDIRLWWPLVKEGGILAGHDFNHKWPGIERAIAESFNLMQVGVGPDSVWFVIKQPGAELRG